MKLALKICFVVIACIAVLITAQALQPPANPNDTTIIVSAAASLTDAFSEIAAEFEAENPDVKIELNLAGSGSLRLQIEAGAPIDVFASASQKDMDILAGKGLIDDQSRTDFVQNSLVLVVPQNGVADITSIEDLRGADVVNLAMGNPDTAPAGRYAKLALEDAGIWDDVESRIIFAENVRQVLAYVQQGEVDAGFVYLTDVNNAQRQNGKGNGADANYDSDNSGIRVASSVPLNRAIQYSVAVISSSNHKDEAQDFINFVKGEKGQEILESYGFG